MTDIQIEGGTLTANAHERVVSGLLCSYNEVGNTNLGKVSIDPGAVALPDDVTVLALNVDHDREDPRGSILSVNDSASGMFAAFRIAEGKEGDELLADIASGKRAKLSAEIKNVVIRGGKIVGGKLFGAASVAKGAFPSASLLAADVGTPDPTTPPATDGTTTGVVEEDYVDENGKNWHKKTTTTTVVDGDSTTITTTVEITEPPAAAADGTQNGDSTVGQPVPTLTAAAALGAGGTPKQPNMHTIFAALEAVQFGRADAEILDMLTKFSGPDSKTLFAALNNIKFDATNADPGKNIVQPQWIDELWSGVEYESTFTDLFAPQTLTSLKINAWRWLVKPQGGTWSGNKTAVPTNTPTTEPYTVSALRWAMGHDIAREYIDFNVPGFMESYYKMGAENYAQWVDETVVATQLLAAAVDVEADNPAGLTIGAGFSALIDGASEVIDNKAHPSFALVETSLWKSMMKTPANNVLGYLTAALGLEEGSLAGFSIRPTSLLPTGNLIVGAREAASVYQLGSTPIRVEAPDMILGGIDTGLFGYAQLVINKADALVQVTPYTP